MPISEQDFFGKQVLINPSANFNMIAGVGRVYVADPTTTVNAILQDARRAPARLGGPVFYLVNLGTDTITIKDNGGSTTVGTVPACSMSQIVLLEADDANGRWFAQNSALLNTGGCTEIPKPCNAGVMPEPPTCLQMGCIYFWAFPVPTCEAPDPPTTAECIAAGGANPGVPLICTTDISDPVITCRGNPVDQCDDCITIGEPGPDGVIIEVAPTGCEGANICLTVTIEYEFTYWCTTPGSCDDCGDTGQGSPFIPTACQFWGDDDCTATTEKCYCIEAQ